jgi:Fe2+ transport system protein FeoA
LGAEHGAVLCEVTVSRYVRRRRVELGLAEGVEVMVPQSHDPGDEAEVDSASFMPRSTG